MDMPYNAGQTIVVKQIVEMPVIDVDFGEITVTENWGRLFIKRGNAEIVVTQHAYNDLCKAISHFINPAQYRRADLPPTLDEALALPEIAALVDAAKTLQGDMLVRAEIGLDTITGEKYRIVNAGDSAWRGFCAALSAIKKDPR